MSPDVTTIPEYIQQVFLLCKHFRHLFGMALGISLVDVCSLRRNTCALQNLITSLNTLQQLFCLVVYKSVTIYH